jgi:hypothetical protein
MAAMVSASWHLDPAYREQLLRERREAVARPDRRSAQAVPGPATKCEYCFARLRPDQARFCSDACRDAHWRLMPVW